MSNNWPKWGKRIHLQLYDTISRKFCSITKKAENEQGPGIKPVSSRCSTYWNKSGQSALDIIRFCLIGKIHPVLHFSRLERWDNLFKHRCRGLSGFCSVGRASPREGENSGSIPGPWTIFALLVIKFSTIHKLFWNWYGWRKILSNYTLLCSMSLFFFHNETHVWKEKKKWHVENIGV